MRHFEDLDLALYSKITKFETDADKQKQIINVVFFAMEAVAEKLQSQTAGKVTIVKEKFYPADKELIEQLHAQVTMLRDWFKKDNFCTCKTCWSCAGKGAAVLSQSSDTWLADHDKEVRRKVLNEVYKEVDCGITYVRWALEIISRMAEQPDALRKPA